MKKTLLMTAVSLLAIETAYAIPGRDQLGDEGLTTVSLRSTRIPRSVSEKGFSDGFEYRWQIKINGTPAHSVRRTAEEKPYVDLRALLRTNPAMSEDEQYSVIFSETDIEQILDLYQSGKLQLSWGQGGLAYQQYCVHPLDGFHTLSVTSAKGKTYYKQQRWEDGIGNLLVRDIFADSRSQLEYRFDPGSQQWLVEGRKGTSRFSDRENAVKALKKLGLKYELKDRARGEYSSEPFYSFTDPATRWALDEVERAKDAAYRPSLWKTLPMGWLALTSGGLIEALRHGLTATTPQPSQAEEAKSSDYSSTVQRASYSVSSLTDLVARAAPYAVTPVLLSMVSSSKSGLRSPLGFLSAFGLGGLGSVAAQYMTDNQPEDGYVPPMGPVFNISDNGLGGDQVLTTLSNGNVFVIWSSYTSDDTLYNIWGSIINESGDIVKKPFLLNATLAYGAIGDLDITSLNKGRSFATWNAYHDHQIYGIVMNDQGYNLTNPFPISKRMDSMFPRVVTLSFDRILASWASYDQNIYGTILNSSGNILTKSFVIAKDVAGDGYYGSIEVASMSSESGLYVWQSLSTQYINSCVVYSNGTISSMRTISNSGQDFSPKISRLANGNAFIVWKRFLTEIYGVQVDKTGNPIGAPTEIFNHGYSPSVAGLTQDNALILWDDPDTSAFYGNLVNSSGINITSPFQIGKIFSADYFVPQPTVTALDNGNALITWQHSYTDIHARIIYANITENE